MTRLSLLLVGVGLACGKTYHLSGARAYPSTCIPHFNFVLLEKANTEHFSLWGYAVAMRYLYTCEGRFYHQPKWSVR